MSKIHALLMSFMPQIRSQQLLDEEYLSESADLFDLERRMREIDDRASRQSTALAAGLYTR